MSVITTRVTVDAGAPWAIYQEARVWTYGDGKFKTNLPAEIRVDMGDATLWLSITDARALVGELNRALAAHDETYRVDLAKAVA